MTTIRTSAALSVPVRREGGEDIAAVTIARPTGGALRGLSLTDILRMDVTTMQTLLPRITDPALTGAEAAALDPADLLALAGHVVAFFMPAEAEAAKPAPAAPAPPEAG